jgi:hypothetical protein
VYYVMQMDMGLTSKFIYFRDRPPEYDGSLWRAGDPLAVPPAAMTLTAVDEKPTALSDLLLAPSDMLVFSPKLVACLDAASVKNIEYFPIRLVDKKTGKITDDYRVANVLGSIACLDVDNSVVKSFADGEGYRAVEEFNLLEDRIKPLPGTKGKPLIFRLAEFKYHLLADESIKTACEGNKITGVEFVPTQEYA